MLVPASNKDSSSKSAQQLDEELSSLLTREKEELNYQGHTSARVFFFIIPGKGAENIKTVLLSRTQGRAGVWGQPVTIAFSAER